MIFIDTYSEQVGINEFNQGIDLFCWLERESSGWFGFNLGDQLPGLLSSD
ncbi:hypothetical protein SAMN05661012_01165 [Chitinophaga sancti]|uniref:Uncharacterized protein n=1 Tax=Chitinophaga sancti TaxID=1004 RepID=A0A1K1NBK3_9BACT|nr:hypothetical protein SAMN05661012_01165 [Chitinophaga sancti]